MKRIPLVLLLLFLVVAAVLSGCGGSVRPTNWTGLVVDDGVLYLADLDQVWAFDAETGAESWRFPRDSSAGSYGPFYTIVLVDRVLFVTSYERKSTGIFARPPVGVLRTLDADGGYLVWGESVERPGEFVAPGAAANGMFVIGNGDGNVYAFDAETGRQVWEFSTGGRVWAAPLVLSDTVYIASLDHCLYALDLATGGEQWRFTAGGAIAAKPLVLGDAIYFGAFDNYLYELDLTTGEERRRFQGGNWFWGEAATDGSTIYAADVNGTVYALNAETFQERWHTATGEVVRLGPVLSADGTLLLVGGDEGTLYGLDVSDGFVLWSREGEGQLGSIAAAGNMVYISRILADEHVQAFFVENGRLAWVYPEAEE
ncbi:MAG: PQQ-binding-like beta-propeller repeat protein [Anaerolineae bacterium]|nr:PQQ-binding-like beta-propeller repeat protein [Anaerolineae bacterium]